jgi:hypothetical protein
MSQHRNRTAAALLALVPAWAQAQTPAPMDVCSLISIEEVNTMVNVPASKTRSMTTKNGEECTFLDSSRKAVFTVEVRPAKLPKAEMDMEAESLQKIYRTSVKPVEIGEGGFWLTTKQELYFRKGKRIVRVVLAPEKDAKAVEAKTQSAGRLIESRLK